MEKNFQHKSFHIISKAGDKLGDQSYANDCCIAIRKIDSSKTTLMVVMLCLIGLFMFNSVSAKTTLDLNITDSPTRIISNDNNNSTYVDKDFKLGAFNGVDISGDIELVITQDTLQSIRVSATEKVMVDIIVKVEGGILKVYSQTFFINKRVKLYISNGLFTSIRARGACNVSNVEKITANNLSIDISGACTVELDVDIKNKVEIKSNGATLCNIVGSTNKLFIDMNGAARIEADELIAKHVEVEASGVSSAWIYASEFVDIEASGASKVQCVGNPKNSKLNAGSATKIDIR